MRDEAVHHTYHTLTEAIRARARRDPNGCVLTILRDDRGPEHFTAAELDTQARAYARGLRNAGIQPDDVVVVAIGDLRPLIGTVLGALYSGAIPAISSFGMERPDADVHRPRVAALVRSCLPRALVCQAERADVLRSLLDGLACETLHSEALCLPGASGAAERWPARASEDIAYLQYSSGTAGTQKGIAHTHRGVLRYIEAKRRVWAQRHQVVISWLPLYHDLGFVSGLLCPVVLGAHAVLMLPQHWIRNPVSLLRAVHEYHGSVSYMPNFAFNHCVRAIRERDLAGLDLRHWNELLCGAEPVREDSLRMFAERFAPYGFRPSVLRSGYGMAELVEGVSGTPAGRFPRVDWIDRAQLEGAQRALPAMAHREGGVSVVSCGVAMDGTEFRVADNQGDPLPDRHVGDVLIRSEYMFQGYYRQPERTAQVMRGEWFCGGDLGYIADGELYLTGRKNDLIIVGGRNVHPEDIETIAETVPGIHPGRSVAFGVPDPRLGSERIVLVCETSQPCDADQQLAMARELRRRVVQELDVTLGDVRFADRGEVIKTSSGKKARPQNRDKYLAQTPWP